MHLEFGKTTYFAIFSPLLLLDQTSILDVGNFSTGAASLLFNGLSCSLADDKDPFATHCKMHPPIWQITLYLLWFCVKFGAGHHHPRRWGHRGWPAGPNHYLPDTQFCCRPAHQATLPKQRSAQKREEGLWWSLQTHHKTHNSSPRKNSWEPKWHEFQITIKNSNDAKDLNLVRQVICFCRCCFAPHVNY